MEERKEIVRYKQNRNPLMTNLLQENREMKSPRTNSTFDFANTQKTNHQKPKELFLPYINKIIKDVEVLI